MNIVLNVFCSFLPCIAMGEERMNAEDSSSSLS